MAKRKSVFNPLHAWVLHIQEKFIRTRKGWDGNRYSNFWDALDGRPQKMRGNSYPTFYYEVEEFDVVNGEIVNETIISISQHIRPNGESVTYYI